MVMVHNRWRLLALPVFFLLLLLTWLSWRQPDAPAAGPAPAAANAAPPAFTADAARARRPTSVMCRARGEVSAQAVSEAGFIAGARVANAAAAGKASGPVRPHRRAASTHSLAGDAERDLGQF